MSWKTAAAAGEDCWVGFVLSEREDEEDNGRPFVSCAPARERCGGSRAARVFERIHACGCEGVQIALGRREGSVSQQGFHYRIWWRRLTSPVRVGIGLADTFGSYMTSHYLWLSLLMDNNIITISVAVKAMLFIFKMLCFLLFLVGDCDSYKAPATIRYWQWIKLIFSHHALLSR